MHADHISGTQKIKDLDSKVKSIISKSSGAMADIHLMDKDKVDFGSEYLIARSTPGHTDGILNKLSLGCMVFISNKHKIAFTGDTILIRGCGRTDFQSDDDYLLYPAHDYKGMTVTSVGEEKKYNPRLTKPKSEFIKIMNNLNLPYPKKMDIALPANKLCGAYEIPKSAS